LGIEQQYEGATMASSPVPAPYHSVSPYLVVEDVAALIDFLKKAVGATDRLVHRAPDGAIAHAEIMIGDSVIMLGSARGSADLTKSLLYVYVADADATYAAAIKAGATSIMAPENQIYGDRAGAFKDPVGNSWWVARHVEDVSEDEVQRRAKEKFSAAAP
jgi:uncharacterized glyoxalase superfamily protein PhnB